MFSYAIFSENINIILASLSGAVIYVLNQHHFDRRKSPFIFAVSFFMGIISCDATLSLAQYFIPCDFPGERPLGAFICSALIVTVIVKVISYIEKLTSGRDILTR
ncbi:putative holin [Pantoea agglomerans]|uniref:putative holin n=1 Tax=Enterobacter agglomerans TaxID=549 RepID=UPI0024138CD5|nr:putative holin [Pantoea agglomerans]